MFDIYYEFIENKEEYLELLMLILDKKKPEKIKFIIDGLSVILTPGMSIEDIKNEIDMVRKEFDSNNIYIEKEKEETLFDFSKRMADLANRSRNYYSSTYHGKTIKAMPGCTYFDILYQMVQINKEKYQAGEIEFDDLFFPYGLDDYTILGKIITEKIMATNENIYGRFGGVDIPFTTDMVRGNVDDDYVVADDYQAFIEISKGMIHAKELFDQAIEGCILEFSNGHAKVG